MNSSDLRAYIEAQPEFAEWIADGVDFKIADAINARTVPVIGGVSRSRFAMWAGKTGIRAAIQDHANTQGSPLRSICLTLLDFLQGGVSDELAMNEPDNQQMLAIWVQLGEITQAQADDLLALATTQQPIFDKQLHHLDVAKALRG